MSSYFQIELCRETELSCNGGFAKILKGVCIISVLFIKYQYISYIDNRFWIVFISFYYFTLLWRVYIKLVKTLFYPCLTLLCWSSFILLSLLLTYLLKLRNLKLSNLERTGQCWLIHWLERDCVLDFSVVENNVLRWMFLCSYWGRKE